MIFANGTAAAVWRENWCDKCFLPAQVEFRVSGGRKPGCRTLARALGTKTVPEALSRNGRDSLMQDAFRCADFMSQPASIRPRYAGLPQEESLFGDLFDPPAESNQSDTEHQ